MFILEAERYKELDFIFAKPESFDKSKKYPALILLHGAGYRGRNIEFIKQNPFFADSADIDIDMVKFAPQCYAESWFDIFEQLQDFIAYVRSLSFVDEKRFYIMGASMGGYGTWQMIMTHPEWFAAAVPVCGGGMYWLAYRLKNMHIRAFHGAEDKSVLPEESEKMVNSAKAGGADAKLELFPGVGHDVWHKAYKDKALYDWMLSYSIEKGEAGGNPFADADKFG